MKSRFNTVDITVVIRELLRFVSMRVMNVYDVDNKTYLIRLGKPDDKAVIVLESGIKIHSTEFEWPKNPAPSGFSMKMRKHLKGRRLESVRQLGIDRIVDLTFGSGEAAYHVILELYDRGNIVLTDYAYTILNILRPRTDNSQDVRFAVRETYPVDAVKQHELPTEEKLCNIIMSAKEGDLLKKVLIPHLDYGPAIIEHCLLGAGIPENAKIGRGFDMSKDMRKLLVAIEEAEDLLNIFQTQSCKGFITQKSEKRPSNNDGGPSELLTYDEFHPMLFRQYQNKKYLEFESFNKAVDQFYSQVESQKIELKTLQQERAAMKKLENVKKDHEKRVEGLQKEQETDKQKGQLIEINLDLVDRAILIVRSAIANQIDWTEIKNIVKEAQAAEDPVAMAIKDLKLDTNHITLLLQNPYVDSDFEDDEDDYIKPMKVDIDLGLSAYANSRKYFEMKKHAAVKEQKTLDASVKALKSAEKKTKETLKEVATAASINKARKTYWFEKFLWFITSENYLVVGGRDQQQNELIVKRHMRKGDIYVHADLHGASSVVIKNPTGEPVPPKTLNEAGTMAICNSAAWDAKVVTSAWWVYPSQVSKTAPSGEYLTTGSFMIRGKKNYLPPSYLIYGFAVLFKLEESSVFRHAGERKVRVAEEDEMSVADSIATESEITIEETSDHELEMSDDEDDELNKERVEGSKDNGTTDDICDTEKEGDDIYENDDRKTEEKDTCTCESTVKEKGEQVKTEDSAIVSDRDNGVKVDENRTKSDNQITEEPQCAIENQNKQNQVEFPDTEISLQHVKGDKYELLRSQSSSSQGTESDIIHLGDNVPVTFGDQQTTHTGGKLSAKQRRELKKAKKQQQFGSQKEDEEDKVSWLAEESQGRSKKTQREDKETQKEQQHSQQQQPKRGQKAKMKKLKEKYKDQDEEERQLRMEILASAGSKKEEKKKGKKGEEKGSGRVQSAQGKKQQQQQQQQKKKPDLVDIIIQDVQDLKTEDTAKEQKPLEGKIVEIEEEERQEEEEKTTTEDVDILNSLTGCPVGEDELLYAIPVCAPYNALNNYKYKVKLLPGSTKRGKATKTALNMFLFDKSIMSREKDLLKILKDADMSRNMPGKVKVTAPNLHRVKKK